MLEQIPLPNFIPEQFAQVTSYKDEPVYDFSKHVDIRLPEYVVNLKFEKFKMADSSSFDFENEHDCQQLREFLAPGLAFTSPFRVMSDEGLRVLNEIIEYHKKNSRPLSKHSNRFDWCMRGLGYVSKFIQDFARCPLVAKRMSFFANKSVASHALPSNIAHTNIGMPGSDKKSIDRRKLQLGFIWIYFPFFFSFIALKLTNGT
jgi:hypothetical protein